ncbi:MAG: proton-conducting transporter membrane subunit [Pyrobaculum sp.]
MATPLEYILAVAFLTPLADLATRRGVAALAISAYVLYVAALGDASPLTNFVKFDELTRGLFIFISGVYFAVSVYSYFYMRDAERRGWFWAWMNLFYASMLIFVAADHYVLLILGWGGLDVASWSLILTYRDDDEMGRVGPGDRKWGLLWLWTPSSSALRAILTVEVGSASLLAGMGLASAAYNTPYISQWGQLGELSTMLVLLAAFVKSAQLPFTDWLMTAMSAPTPVSALLHSSTMVKAGPILLLKLHGVLSPAAAPVAFAVGVATALYGGLVALGQREPKVLLAASTTSYLGLITAYALKNPEEALWLIYAHGVAKAALFMAVGHAIHETHSRAPEEYPLSSKITMGLALLTLVGLTPLGALAKAHAELWTLAFSALTAGYLGRLILRTATETTIGAMAAPYTALAASSLAFPQLPNPIWAVALLGMALAYVPPPEALTRRLWLPWLFDVLAPRVFNYVKSFAARADELLDKVLFRTQELWHMAVAAVTVADHAVDIALHDGFTEAVRRASRAVSARNFDYYIYVGGVGVGVLLLLVLIWIY